MIGCERVDCENSKSGPPSATVASRPLGVVIDVEAVVLAVDDRVAALQRRVEDRRRDLADAAADARHEQAVLDRLALEEAAIGGARADRLR